eukprot:TRINITY_DN6740_c0_g1_i1.p1 TRINITY_DN6740_c0_g1~~TRINITY_DN6740_c0_g1_i1.p1  ORF type:complete len:726 (-),score=160.94 TRINITY_DN6740_c0_g1_i1:300-2477(-)
MMTSSRRQKGKTSGIGNMSLAVVTSDAKGIILSTNTFATKLFGYGRAQMVGKNVSMLMGSPYREQHDSYMARYAKTQVPRVLGTSRIVTGQHADGSSLQMRLTLSKMTTDGKVIFAAIIECVHPKMTVITIDAGGVIQKVSGRPMDLLGYEADELVDQKIDLIVPCPHKAKHDSYLERYKTSGVPHVVGRYRNLKAQHKDPSHPLIPVSLHVTEEVNDGKSTFKGTLSPVESELEAMATVTLKGTFASCNENFSVLFGCTPKDLVGKSLDTIVDDSNSLVTVVSNDIALPEKEQKILGRGEVPLRGLHSDGSHFGILISADMFVIGDVGSSEVMFQVRITRPDDEEDLSEEAVMARIEQTPDEFGVKPTLPGQMLGAYEFDRVLGSGFFGKVKLAHHRLTGELVAIKTLRKKQYESVKMPYPPREVSLLKRIRHPNICMLYDTIELDDRLILIMEYADGGDLYEYSEDAEYLTEVEARRLFRQLVSSVDYLHQNGIVHRDLKLENILLDHNRDIKLIDLGLGNFFDTHNLLKTFCGSADYAAPELWLAQPYKGPAVDIWSLGVVLFTLLTGRMPFADARQVVSGRLFFPTQPPLSMEVKKFMTGLLEADENKRLTMDQLRQHKWMNIGFDKHCMRSKDPMGTLTPSDDVLAHLETLGFDKETVRTSLAKGEHNQMTTTYFLVARQFARKARTSKTALTTSRRDVSITKARNDALKHKDEKGCGVQ